jgi:hypothetical protein
MGTVLRRGRGSPLSADHPPPPRVATGAPVAAELIQLIWERTIGPGKVFDLTLLLEKAPEARRRWTGAGPSRSFSLETKSPTRRNA